MTITLKESNVQISPHQLSIARLVAEGHTAKEIGVILNTSERNVDAAMVRLRKNLGAKNTVHVIVMLMRHKIIK